MDQELIQASNNGHTETVKLLLEHGANKHAKDDYCIRLASHNGHTETVKLLLEHGANIHAQDDYSIRYASMCGHFKTVKLLIENGADIHVNDDLAIQSASLFGHLNVVKLLYWNYKSESKRESIEKGLPESKKLWNDIRNCEFLPLPFEIVELIKRGI
jgi:ankyrin repeat protein